MASLGTNSSDAYSRLYTPLWDPFYSSKSAEIGHGSLLPSSQADYPKNLFQPFAGYNQKPLPLETSHKILSPASIFILPPKLQKHKSNFWETLSPYCSILVAIRVLSFSSWAKLQWERRCFFIEFECDSFKVFFQLYYVNCISYF